MAKGPDEERIERARQAVRAFLRKKDHVLVSDNRFLQEWKKAEGATIKGGPDFDDDDRVIHEGNLTAVSELAEEAKYDPAAWGACVLIMEKQEHFGESWPACLQHLALEAIRGNKPKKTKAGKYPNRDKIIRRAIKRAVDAGAAEISNSENRKNPDALDIVSQELEILAEEVAKEAAEKLGEEPAELAKKLKKDRGLGLGRDRVNTIRKEGP